MYFRVFATAEMPLASRIEKIKIKKISIVPGYGKIFSAAANILSNRARNPVKLGSRQMGVVGTSRRTRVTGGATEL